MYSKVPYSQQVPVYFRKISRISIRESAWKNVLFSLIIGLIVGALCPQPLMSGGVFILVSGCIWLGIFNTIQSLCKEHDIINSEYRQGMNIGAFVTAHIMFQSLLCLAQSTMIFMCSAIFGVFKDISGGNVVLAYFYLYILTFASSILGLMVSAIAKDPTTAMTIMPFLLIVQLLLGDFPIDLKGFAESLSYITFSRWGIGALSVYANDTRFFENNSMNSVGGLFICILLGAVFAGATYVALKFRNRDS